MKGEHKKAGVTIQGFAPTVHVHEEARATDHVDATVIRAVQVEMRAEIAWDEDEHPQITIEEAQKYLQPIRPAAEQPVCLRLCEAIVAITAPKGRIDEFLGDHRTELRTLVSEFGVVRGTWICRLRLTGTTLRMLPTIVVRLWVLWKIS